MTMEKVQAAVLAKAEADAAGIVEDARRDADARVEAAGAQAQAAYEAAIAAATARAERETARELGRARHEGRLAVLAAKNAVLDGVFARARDAFRATNDWDYRGLLGGWLKSLPAETGGALRVNPRETKRFPREFVDWINEGRSGPGRFTDVVPDPAVPNGLVLEGADFTVDFTVERRLARLRESLAAELSRELFA
jgi:vacuolar-type H+-ATPase subunit E/Vma4